MHQVQTSPVDDHFEQLHFDDVSVKHDASDEVFATLKIKLRNGTWERPASLKVKVDTGAQGNILPLRTFIRCQRLPCDEESAEMHNNLDSI